MRMVSRWVGGIGAGALALGAVASAVAQAPTAGTATQPGAWGWQQGAAPVAQPSTTPAAAPTPAAVPIAASAPVAAPMPDAPPAQHRWMAPGAKVPKPWRDQRYVLADWPAYRLPQPGPGMRWMRYYDDVALIDEHGRVIDVRHDVASPAPPAAMPANAAAPVMPAPPVPGTVRTGNTTVTTSVTTVAPPVEVGGAWNGGQVLSVTPGYVVTTTTRTSEVIPPSSRASRRALAHR